MADGIYYNAEVTSDDLNDLARDLGATSFNGFDGVTKFGTDELNKITAHLVSKGILNRDNLCKPVIVDDKVNIQSGIIVFNNGAKKVIKDVVSVDKVNNTYVYALNDTAAGNCKLVVSENDPETDENVRSLDYIPIAFIDENGALTDKRIFSKANVIIPVSNQYYEKRVTVDFNYKMSPDDVLETLHIEGPINYVWAKLYDSSHMRILALPEGEKVGSIEVYVDSYLRFKRDGSEVKLYGSSSRTGYAKGTFTLYFA